MTDWLFTACIAGIGLATLLPLSRKIPRYALPVLAVPIGSAAYITAGLILLGLPTAFSTARAVTLAACSAAAIAAAGMASPRSRLGPGAAGGAVSWVVIAVVAVTIGAIFFDVVPLARFTTDSVRYAISADTLERFGTITEVEPYDLRMRQLGTPLLHTVGAVTGRGYSATITPLIALSGLGMMAWLAAEAFDLMATPTRWRWALLATAFLALLTSNRFVYNAFYVNGHMVFAVLLLAGAGLSWLAALQRDDSLLLPAGLAFGAMATMRAEAAIVVAIFLLPLLAPGRLSNGAAARLLTPFIATVAIWNGVVYPSNALPGDMGILGPVRGPLFAAGAVALLATLRNHRRFAFIATHAPRLAGVALAGVVVLGTMSEPSILWRTVDVTFHNLLRHGRWGALWWVAIPLSVLAMRFARYPLQIVWTAPLRLFPIAFIAFAFLRGDAYRLGWSDSGNRMLLHVLLVCATYLVMAGASLVRPKPIASEDEIDLTDGNTVYRTRVLDAARNERVRPTVTHESSVVDTSSVG